MTPVATHLLAAIAGGVVAILLTNWRGRLLSRNPYDPHEKPFGDV